MVCTSRSVPQDTRMAKFFARVIIILRIIRIGFEDRPIYARKERITSSSNEIDGDLKYHAFHHSRSDAIRSQPDRVTKALRVPILGALQMTRNPRTRGDFARGRG